MGVSCERIGKQTNVQLIRLIRSFPNSLLSLCAATVGKGSANTPMGDVIQKVSV